MKKYLAIPFSALLLTGCLKDKHIEKKTYVANAPIYMSYERLANEVKIEEPREVCTPRKFYSTGQFLFVNELGKGVHIINNVDPRNPVNLKFISLPGNVDMSVKGDYLYADSYSDLVTFDVSDVNNITEVCRETRVFEYVLPPHNTDYPISMIDPIQGVVVDWEVKQVTEECVNGDCGQSYSVDFNNERLVMNDMAFAEGGTMQTGKMEGVNVAGSMSRFMVRDNNLYAISSISDVAIFDVSNAACPTKDREVELQWGIETLFSYKDKMFVGAETGMYIYDLSNEDDPTYVSTFEHVESCDPVVVYEDKAYVTVRAGGECGGWESQLNVIDITNIEQPREIASYTLSEPYGLGIDGQNDILFVCDGSAGVRIFENIDSQADAGYLQQTSSLNVDSYDVIPMNGHMILVGNSGVNQYNYSNINDIQLMSQINTGNCE